MADATEVRVEFEYLKTHAFLWKNELAVQPRSVMVATGELALAGKKSNYLNYFLTLYNQGVTLARETGHDGTQAMYNIARALEEILEWYLSSEAFVKALEQTGTASR